MFRSKSGYTGADIGRYHQPGSNGLAFSPDGLLTICQHGNRRVIRVNPHGDTTVLADSFDGRRLNSPNDLVYRSDGTLYFTDPPFGLPGRLRRSRRRSCRSAASTRVRDGEVSLVTRRARRARTGSRSRPTSAGSTSATGTPSTRPSCATTSNAADAGELLCDLTDEPGEDAIDGIKVDPEGRLYVCGPGGIWVLSPEGEKLELIELPEAPHNLAWGDADGRSLYVTAMTSIYRIRRNP